MAVVNGLNWSPPDGWIQLESALEGVEIWGPAPVEEDVEGPKTTRCRSCGAAARFDVNAGRLACPFCGWQDAAAEVVGRSAEAGEFTQASLAAGKQGFGVDRRELSCEQCGAAIALDEGVLSASCPFCASNQINVREQAEASGLRPTALVRFSVLPKDISTAVKTWLGTGWFHPGGLGSVASVDRFMGIYLPYWTFSAKLDSDWKAEVGTSRTESYRDSDGNHRTRTVIDWNWRSGHVHLDLRDTLIPGTTKVSETLLGRIAAFEMGDLVTYDAGLLAGWGAQTYDRSLPDAWEMGRHAMRERARSACHSDTGSSHVRSFSMTADLDDESWRHVLLPVYVSAYRFADRTFVVVANGQTGEVAGQKPVAWWKVWTAIAAMLSPGIITGLIGIPLLLFAVGIFVLIVALIMLIAGVIGSIWVYNQAVQSEAL